MKKFSQLVQGVGAGGILRFLLLNFSAPIVFYVTFHFVGPRPAIGFAIAVALLQAFIQWRLKRPFSPFFISSTTFICLFGASDLFLRGSGMFRYEPTAENIAIGLVFAGSLALGKPILAWFAAALPEALKRHTEGRSEEYLRGLTAVWSGYFFAKAAMFYYLATRVNLGKLFVLRSVLGGGSAVLLIGLEMALAKAWQSKRNPRRA